MSERTPHNFGEKFESLSEHNSTPPKERLHEKHEVLKENKEKKEQAIENFAHQAQERAKSSEQIVQEAAAKEYDQEEHEPAVINHELKEIAYQRLLKRAQRHLSPYSRTMSKVMHQPAVDAASEVVSKTVGRPSGIIGGGLMALAGTSIYYYLARHYGYSYTPFVFIILMAVGFVIGWCAELIYKSVRILIKK
jgi:hypothetical protein